MGTETHVRKSEGRRRLRVWDDDPSSDRFAELTAAEVDIAAGNDRCNSLTTKSVRMVIEGSQGDGAGWFGD